MSAEDARETHLDFAEEGQAVTITRLAEGTYDPATGSAPVTTTAQSSVGCVFPYSPGLRNQPATLIAENDQQLLLSTLDMSLTALNPAPSVNDRITLANGTIHTIEAIQTLAPAGIPIFHDCRIRGAS